MKAIINITLYDFKKYQPHSYVIFDEKIREVGLMEDFEASKYLMKNGGSNDLYDVNIQDGEGKLFMPGLVNFHTHIYSTLVRGLDMGVRPRNFREVLSDIWWYFDRQLTVEDLYTSARLYGMDSIRSGVTALIDHNASGEIEGSIPAIRRAVKETLGMKGLFCFETSDRFDIAQCIDENIQALGHGDGLFGLHASMTLSPETLAEISDVLGAAPIHIHVAESMEDQEDAMAKYQVPVVKRLEQYNLLNEGSILAHCVHIDEQEVKSISSHGCTVAVNPTSNLNNAVGLFDYRLLKEHGIDMVVGTDGLGTNVAREWQNLFYVGKQSMADPGGIGLDDIRQAMVRSYEIFNELSGEKIGRLEEDFAADFMLVDYDPPTPMDDDNIFAHVFYGILENLRPHTVYANGVLRLEDYQLTYEKVDVDEQIETLWERVRG